MSKNTKHPTFMFASACMLISACALAMAKPAAAAATDDGTFAARGIGANRCAEIVTLLTGPERDMAALQLSSWIAGYLSHANRTTSGIYDVVPVQDTYAIATIVARLCATNPDALVEPVMARVVSQLANGAQTQASDIMTVSADGEEVSIHQDAMVAVQRRLIARGHLESGNDDGVFGSRTRKALSDFQSSVGLEENGLPNALTLYLLFDEH